MYDEGAVPGVTLVEEEELERERDMVFSRRRSQTARILDCCAYKRRYPFTVRASQLMMSSFSCVPVPCRVVSRLQVSPPLSLNSSHLYLPPTFARSGLQAARPTPSFSPLGLKVEEIFRRAVPAAPEAWPLRWSLLMEP